MNQPVSDPISEPLRFSAEQRWQRAHDAELRLMAVHAHPDDESSKGAATLARYSDEGVGVLVVSCTGGERGDILNKKFVEAEIDMPSVRLREMARAAEILGVAHLWLGYEDSGYHEGEPDTWQLPADCFGALPIDAEVETLVRAVRQFRPHVMTTYDENGGYPHPDHIRCHEISVAAFEAAGDPDRFPDAGEPWTPQKLYYNGGFSAKRMTAINDAVKEATGVGPFDEWVARMKENNRPDRSDRITTRIPIGDFFDRRDQALLAHETQIDPDSHWFAVPREIEAHVWGTDDYELAQSRVPVTLPEGDMFAGIREPAAALDGVDR
ncbi:MAG: mycothiol conjugate amidase Mca [Nakamurella sp.]